MNKFLCIIFMIDGIYSEVSVVEQLKHVLKRRQESHGLANNLMNGFLNTRRLGSSQNNLLPQRRYDFYLDHNDASGIIGAPSMPSHLPEAEPILPGHTLIRPALGMLKSAIKFPHRELENGAGVLGNYNNLGIKYDGKNERVLYTGFRRNAPSIKTRRKSSYLADTSLENNRGSLYEYIMVVPTMKKSKPSFTLSNLILDINNQSQMNDRVLERLKLMKKPVKKQKRLIMYVTDPTNSPLQLTDLFEDKIPDENTFLPIKTAPAYYYLDSVEQETVENLPNSRREEVIEAEGDDDDDDEEENATEKPFLFKNPKEEKAADEMTKREKFYATKNLFNVVKIHQDMYNYEDLVPDLKNVESSVKGKDRPWWFFNEVDFEPFHRYEN